MTIKNIKTFYDQLFNMVAFSILSANQDLKIIVICNVAMKDSVKEL